MVFTFQGSFINVLSWFSAIFLTSRREEASLFINTFVEESFVYFLKLLELIEKILYNSKCLSVSVGGNMIYSLQVEVLRGGAEVTLF